MQQELIRIMELQPLFSDQNTPEMSERGMLVRGAGPDWLRTFSEALSEAMGIDSSDLLVEGRDGTGRKTEVPWFRFGSRTRSPSATQDWYCVYLFDTHGDNCFLSLAHGSTVWNGVDFRPRPADELRQLANWGREMAKPLSSERSDLSSEMSLHSRRSNLGPSYEAGTALSLTYSRSEIPTDDQLRDDALYFARLLRMLYDASDLMPSPLGPAPEVVEALDAADQTAGKARTKHSGQGFRLNVAQKRAIELRAMALARNLLENEDWKVSDTSKNKPYDFHCIRSGEELYVEVKGTTSGGDTVVLTRNEVEHHATVHPANALIVVHSIQLGGIEHDEASGGVVEFISPWKVDPDHLRVISYLYNVRG